MPIDPAEAFSGILVGRGGPHTCPECKEKVDPGDDVCPRCGRRINWGG